MNDDDTTTSETSTKAKNEEKKELPTLPAEMSIEDSTKSANEKKVVVVKPGDPDVKTSDTAENSEGARREDDKKGQ